MKIKWARKAEKNLERILVHTEEHFSFELAQQVYWKINFAVQKLSEFPELGRRIGGLVEKRSLIIAGNTIVYEIVLRREPLIVIRNVLPRKTEPID